jgi:hypothetical protein
MDKIIESLIKDGDLYATLIFVGSQTNPLIRNRDYKFVEEKFLAGAFQSVSTEGKSQIQNFFDKVRATDDFPGLISFQDMKLFNDLYCKDRGITPIS